jgi:nitroimidazol reductase NimA-like FMN-containing flavoprotein (pyridoxamine 5'-phosphate oxidase superfamily)
MLSSGDMIGELSTDEIEELLLHGHVGRLGCHAEGRTYIVPIAYAYDGESVIAHSSDGLKIRTMRANPAVCFEVDDIRGLDDWRSVIAWGAYEELWGRALESAAGLLQKRFAALRSNASANPRRHDVERAVVYRVRLTTKTGRFERP